MCLKWLIISVFSSSEAFHLLVYHLSDMEDRPVGTTRLAHSSLPTKQVCKI